MGRTAPKLSKYAVENIFQLRADGKSYMEIAERYPCSDHYIRQVISRKRYGDVEIDAGLVHGAQNLARSKPKKRKPKEKPQPAVPDKYESLVTLMKAQEQMSIARAACVKAGFSDSFLDEALEEVQDID